MADLATYAVEHLIVFLFDARHGRVSLAVAVDEVGLGSLRFQIILREALAPRTRALPVLSLRILHEHRITLLVLLRLVNWQWNVLLCAALQRHDTFGRALLQLAVARLWKPQFSGYTQLTRLVRIYDKVAAEIEVEHGRFGFVACFSFHRLEWRRA